MSLHLVPAAQIWGFNMDPRLNLDAIEVTQMANGHLCLSLSSAITWECFPAFADDFLIQHNGKVLDKAESPETRIWTVEISETIFRLVFDDYPIMVSLESSTAKGDIIIKDLHSILSGKA